MINLQWRHAFVICFLFIILIGIYHFIDNKEEDLVSNLPSYEGLENESEGSVQLGSIHRRLDEDLDDLYDINENHKEASYKRYLNQQPWNERNRLINFDSFYKPSNKFEGKLGTKPSLEGKLSYNKNELKEDSDKIESDNSGEISEEDEESDNEEINEENEESDNEEINEEDEESDSIDEQIVVPFTLKLSPTQQRKPKNITVIPWSNANKSKGERLCSQILSNLTQTEFMTVRIEELKNPLTGQPLEIDCYNEEWKLGLEYQGPQHYHYPNWTKNSLEEFKEQVYRDEYKREKCYEIGISLIEVPYTVPFDKLEQFIIDKLYDYGFTV